MIYLLFIRLPYGINGAFNILCHGIKVQTNIEYLSTYVNYTSEFTQKYMKVDIGKIIKMILF